MVNLSQKCDRKKISSSDEGVNELKEKKKTSSREEVWKRKIRIKENVALWMSVAALVVATAALIKKIFI